MVSIDMRSMIGLAIGVAVIVGVIPTAIGSWMDVNTTGWSVGAAALWDLSPLIIIAVVITAIAGGFMAKRRSGGL